VLTFTELFEVLYLIVLARVKKTCVAKRSVNKVDDA
jgi:hypothetical protein